MQNSSLDFNSSLSHANGTSGSPTKTGLRLVLPPLSAIKAANSQGNGLIGSANGKKKGKGKTGKGKGGFGGFGGDDEAAKRAPRPVKLKPLKEVLSKLIAQIKKKDDYAFFLKPVDLSLVQGYTDVVTRPMDFGTISDKVKRGRYRTLEEFGTDVHLVTSNAKIFNPPGTIYHTEADRIEKYAVEHINRAAASVIEYEGDWNIEGDTGGDEGMSVDGEDGLDGFGRGTPMDVEGSGSVRGRSPSVMVSGQQTSAVPGKRGKKKQPGNGTLSVTLEEDGHLPGYKDGVGVFPVDNEWASVMLALKLKGKRYKTKKERLRIEKEGPPMTPEGSLDFWEVEDHFSILHVFLPERRTKPLLTNLFPPASSVSAPNTYPCTPVPSATRTPFPSYTTQALPTPTTSTTVNSVFPVLPIASSLSGSTAVSTAVSTPIQPSTLPPYQNSIQPPSQVLSFVGPVNLPTTRTIPEPSPYLTSSSAASQTQTQWKPKKRKHWTISRNPPSRRTTMKDGQVNGDDVQVPGWQVPREPHVLDWGAYATMVGRVAEEQHISDKRIGEELGSEDKVVDAVRRSVESNWRAQGVGKVEVTSEDIDEKRYFERRKEEAEEYVKDVVYGGVFGMGYVRSLAEFASPSAYLDGEDYADPYPYLDDEDTPKFKACSKPMYEGLGRPLAQYVAEERVDRLTEGRHRLLRETALYVNSLTSSNPIVNNTSLPITSFSTSTLPSPHLSSVTPPFTSMSPSISSSYAIPPPPSPQILPFLTHSLRTLPYIACMILTIRRILFEDKIDMEPLLWDPRELFLADGEWAGGEFARAQAAATAAVQGYAGSQGAASTGAAPPYVRESPEMLAYALQKSAELVGELVGKGTRVYLPLANGEERKENGTVAEKMVKDKEAGEMKTEVEAKHLNEKEVVDEDMQMGENAAEHSAATPPDAATKLAHPADPSSAHPQASTVQAQASQLPAGEDPTYHLLRMNLLALAKRAPLDKIAPLPAHLVPSFLRTVVPTVHIGSSSGAVSAPVTAKTDSVGGSGVIQTTVGSDLGSAQVEGQALTSSSSS